MVTTNRRLWIVANRLPLKVTECDEEHVEYSPSAGGLATGLASLKVDYEKHWIGWPGVTPENEKVEQNIQRKLEGDNIHPLFLTEHDMEHYYKGFSNGTIWPLFHYFANKADYDREDWEVYQKVNQRFCDLVVKLAGPNDIIWVHDYQLMLLPEMLRERLPDAQIGFFLHIPFPSYEIYRTLPWRKELLKGLLGADLIGLHTSNYMRHFVSAVYRVLGYESNLGAIDLGIRVVQVDTHPMGIDYDKFQQSGESQEVQKHVQEFQKELGEYQLILSVDRLDYSKGILQRLKGFDQFLTQYPEYIEKVSLMLVVVPSRDDIGEYQQLKEEIDKMAGHINGKYSTIHWMPIQYYYRAFPFEQLTAMYQMADVALLTPFRDGMNLIAKEFVATKTNPRGVLILSEMAGTAMELPQAVTINPNDLNDIAQAIHTALTMPEEEQTERLLLMKQRLRKQTVQTWANDFINQLGSIYELQKERKKKEFTSENSQQLIKNFHGSQKRLILLDYDGTLVSFVDRPEKAAPDEQLLNLLDRLSHLENTSVVIISGRNHHTLGEWFSGLKHVGLIGEHGSWFYNEGTWEHVNEPDISWKEDLRPIFDQFADKTPGSFVEEKPFSLVWHYRKTDAWIAELRSQELIKALVNPCTEHNLQVMTGHKVVEVKVSGMDKGTGAQHWLDKANWDFVLAVGDDRTDEDMFEALPEDAYSIRVGYEQTAARYNVPSNEGVRGLLRQMLDKQH